MAGTREPRTEPGGQSISLRVNGRAVVVSSSPLQRLSRVLREELGLTGTKVDATRETAELARSCWMEIQFARASWLRGRWRDARLRRWKGWRTRMSARDCSNRF